MLDSGKIVIDANASVAQSTIVLSGGESLITLYVFSKDGSHRNHEIGLEFSPDIANGWMKYRETVIGGGFMTLQIAAKQVRPCVVSAEGEASQVDVYILAR